MDDVLGVQAMRFSKKSPSRSQRLRGSSFGRTRTLAANRPPAALDSREKSSARNALSERFSNTVVEVRIGTAEHAHGAN